MGFQNLEIISTDEIIFLLNSDALELLKSYL